MLEQWKQFLNENSAKWSYNIVPSLVEKLADAIDKHDVVAVRKIANNLARQGIAIDSRGDLCFIEDIIKAYPLIDEERSE